MIKRKYFIQAYGQIIHRGETMWHDKGLNFKQTTFYNRIQIGKTECMVHHNFEICLTLRVIIKPINKNTRKPEVKVDEWETRMEIHIYDTCRPVVSALFSSNITLSYCSLEKNESCSEKGIVTHMFGHPKISKLHNPVSIHKKICPFDIPVKFGYHWSYPHARSKLLKLHKNGEFATLFIKSIMENMQGFLRWVCGDKWKILKSSVTSFYFIKIQESGKEEFYLCIVFLLCK